MVSHGSKSGMGKKQKLHPEKSGALMTHGGRRMQTSRVARTGGISRRHRLHRLRRPDQCNQPKRLSFLSQPRLQPNRLQHGHHVQRQPNSRETSWCRSSLRSRLHRQSHPRHCLRHHHRCQGLPSGPAGSSGSSGSASMLTMPKGARRCPKGGYYLPNNVGYVDAYGQFHMYLGLC